MAVEIRPGGKEPIVVNNWQSAAKSVILDKFYDESPRGALADDATFYMKHRFDHQGVEKRYSHLVTEEDVKLMVREMFVDGWLEVSNFDLCAVRHCDTPQNINMEHIMKHARLRLTQKGYDKVHEHIFP